MEIKVADPEIIKFEKGNSIKDFYYWLLHLLSQEAYYHLIETIRINQWWYKRLPVECMLQIDSIVNKNMNMTS